MHNGVRTAALDVAYRTCARTAFNKPRPISQTRARTQTYMYAAFPTSTTTRSGYDVRRKHLAVAAVARDGVAYSLLARRVCMCIVCVRAVCVHVHICSHDTCIHTRCPHVGIDVCCMCAQCPTSA